MGKNRASAGLEMMADIFSPIIPILVIGGTAKAFLSLLAAVGLTDQWEKSWQILKLAADVPDVLFPVLLAVSASRKFHGNGLAAAMIGGIFAVSRLAAYENSVISILLTIWFAATAEAFFRKRLPHPILSAAAPILTILMVIPAGWILWGVVGDWMGNLFYIFISLCNRHVQWLVPALTGAWRPLLSMAGMDPYLILTGTDMLTAIGEDLGIGPGMLASNLALGGASLAVTMKAKQKRVQSRAAVCGLLAFCGIAEPAIYGIGVRFRKSLAAAMIGGGAAGCFMGIFWICCYAQVMPGIFALPAYIGPDGRISLYFAITACVIAFAVSFSAAWLLGIEDEETT